VPGFRQGQDFAPIYCASRLWIHGLDPYDDALLKAEGAKTGITTPIGLPNFPAVYPPLTLIATAPIALLPFPVARGTVLVLNLLALGGCWWELVRRFGWRLGEARSRALGVVVLSLAGVHTCIKDGQLTPIVLVGILVALDPRAGTLHAALGWIVALLKYSIPPPYMAFSILRRPRGSVIALLVAGSIFAAAVALVAAPLGFRGLVRDYTASVAALFAAGARDDPTRIGEGTASMLWLKALLYRVLSFAPAIVPALNALVITGMACVLALLILRCRDEGRVLLVIGTFVLLTSYHRVYDAVLLLPGIAWLIDRHAGHSDWENRLLAALLVLFLVPGPAVLQSVLPDQLKSHWLVYAIVIPHQTWCLLAIFVVASRVSVSDVMARDACRVNAVAAKVI
jgi:hypothetical protein